MEQRRIYCDKTELVLMVLENMKIQTYNLTYDRIIRIQFDNFYERRFLILKKPSERIEIITNKRSNPIIFTKMRNKKFFNEYKKDIQKFAKDNSITFINKLYKTN